MHEGHGNRQDEEPLLEPVTIKEEMEEALHKLGASTVVMANLKEVDSTQMPKSRAGPLDSTIRVRALRCMSYLFQASTSGYSHWFKAALLLDRFAASEQFRLEHLPLTCVCVTRIVLKHDASLQMAMPFTHARCSAMNFIKDLGAWLKSAHACVTTEVSDRELTVQEQRILKALDWQVSYPCVEQMCFAYFARFGMLAGADFQPLIQPMQAKVLIVARAVVMCIPTTDALSHGRLAAGLFANCFVEAGYLPLNNLKPEKMSVSNWHALAAATQPRGELPQCRVPAATSMQVFDMICLAVGEEPAAIRAAASQTVQALGETYRQINSFQAEQGA